MDIHAIAVPASVPTLANVNILLDTLHIPSTAGGGDALEGALAPAALLTQPDNHAGANVSIAHVDAPNLSHLDPLASLGHAIHHA